MWASKDCPPLSQIAWLMEKKEEREKREGKRQKPKENEAHSVALFGTLCCCCSMLYHHAPQTCRNIPTSLKRKKAHCVFGAQSSEHHLTCSSHNSIGTTSPFPHSFVRSLCQQQHKAVAAVGQHRRSSSLDFQRMRRLVVPAPPKEVSDATFSLLFTY